MVERLLHERDHAGHDLELVAAFAAADVSPADEARARAVINACAECAGLADDLRSIASAVRGLDHAEAVAARVPAPRDFLLTPEQAARLRPTSRIARLAGGVLGGIAAFGRPLGATLATFGLVGLLVGSVSLGPLGGAASVPAEQFTTSGPEVGGQPGYAPAATASEDRTVQVHPLASDAQKEAGPILPIDAGGSEPAPVAWWLGGSLAVLLAGVALLLASRRRPAGAGRSLQR